MDFWIAHRGNVFGPDPERENEPSYIEAALEQGYHVEVDVWFKDGKWLLGHDEGTYEVELDFLRDDRIWCHAKNLEALSTLIEHQVHVFSHDCDRVVLTSRGYLWTYPGTTISTHTICVMPERAPRGTYTLPDIWSCRGLCSDYVGIYKQQKTCNVRIGMLIGGRMRCFETDLLPKVLAYYKENPTHSVDVHVVVNENDAISLEHADINCPVFGTVSSVSVAVHEDLRTRAKSDVNVDNTMSMFYTNMKAFEQLSAYAHTNGVVYDVVLKYRPDIVCKQLPVLPESLKLNTVYYPSCQIWGDFGGMNDQVAYGLPSAIRTYTHAATHISDYTDPNGPNVRFHPESLLRYHLDTNKVVLEKVQYEYHLNPKRRDI